MSPAFPRKSAAPKGGPVKSKTPTPANPAEPFEIDDTDAALIDYLRRDGRASNRELAQALGLTEATVRTRLRRLEDSHTMKVVAMTDFRAEGLELMASVGIQVKGRPAADVAADLAKLPQVLNANIVIGTSDIEIFIAAHDREELALLLTDTLVNLPGVHRLTTGMALDVLKFQWGWVPFL